MNILLNGIQDIHELLKEKMNSPSISPISDRLRSDSPQVFWILGWEKWEKHCSKVEHFGALIIQSSVCYHGPKLNRLEYNMGVKSTGFGIEQI